jgi:Tfp pilus assembly protein PilN
MSPMQMLLILWGVVTLVLIVLMIYRSTLTIHEDDQLFLSDSESQLKEEQAEIQKKMTRIQPMVRILGAASGMLLIVMAGIWLLDAYKHFNG